MLGLLAQGGAGSWGPSPHPAADPDPPSRSRARAPAAVARWGDGGIASRVEAPGEPILLLAAGAGGDAGLCEGESQPESIGEGCFRQKTHLGGN